MVMEDATFDAVTQRLGVDHSRRRVFGGLIATVAGLTGAAVFSESDVDAKRRRRRRRKKRDKVCHFGDTIKVKKSTVNRHLAEGDYKGACFNACPPGRCNVAGGEVCCQPGSAQNTDSCAPTGGTCCGAGGFVAGIGAACCTAGSKGVSCPTGEVCCPATSSVACAASAGAC
jgi:hypothetical protein